MRHGLRVVGSQGTCALVVPSTLQHQVQVGVKISFQRFALVLRGVGGHRMEIHGKATRSPPLCLWQLVMAYWVRTWSDIWNLHVVTETSLYDCWIAIRGIFATMKQLR